MTVRIESDGMGSPLRLHDIHLFEPINVDASTSPGSPIAT